MSAELAPRTVADTGVKAEIIPAERPQVPRLPAPTSTLEMLNNAVAAGYDVSLVEKLMDLHERWETGQSRKAFEEAIADAKSELAPVVRNKTGHNSKRYADLAAIASAVDPVLSKYGLSYRFRTAQTDKISVTCIVAHKAGHFEETSLAGPPDASGSKNAIQAIGSTLTYLQRYSLVQALGLAATDDDDGKASGSAVEDDGPVSEDQAREIRRLLDETNSDIAKFCRFYRIEALPELPATKFEEAKARILGRPPR